MMLSKTTQTGHHKTSIQKVNELTIVPLPFILSPLDVYLILDLDRSFCVSLVGLK